MARRTESPSTGRLRRRERIQLLQLTEVIDQDATVSHLAPPHKRSMTAPFALMRLPAAGMPRKDPRRVPDQVKRLNRDFRIALSQGNQWVNPLDIDVELTDTLPTGHFAFTPRRRH